MAELPQQYSNFDHLGTIPDGPQGDPGDSTSMLVGDYRNAPGSDTFFKQSHLPDAVNIPAVID